MTEAGSSIGRGSGRRPGNINGKAPVPTKEE